MATGKTEEIEEERRLLYVAMTRAKDQLALIVPHRFYTHGQSRTGDQHPLCLAQPLHSGQRCRRVRDVRVATSGTRDACS